MEYRINQNNDELVDFSKIEVNDTKLKIFSSANINNLKNIDSKKFVNDDFESFIRTIIRDIFNTNQDKWNFNEL